LDNRPANDERRVRRVGIFVDWQNCYRTARDAFGLRGSASGIPGNNIEAAAKRTDAPFGRRPRRRP
jgi:hypothetical protein